ncbi:MAG: hypothetical protein ABWZ42_11880 [Ilumatobacteraceae bacterium]
MSTGPIRLWDGVAPGSEEWTHDEQPVAVTWGGAGERVRNVVVPTMTAYLPEQPTDRAVLVLPGGAMHFLSMESEGREVATFLSARGIATFVVKYRLVPTPPDDADFEAALVTAFGSGIDAILNTAVPLAAADAERATAMVRDRGFAHVTMLGFSAGASVTVELIAASPHPPDAAALVYLPFFTDRPGVATKPPVFGAAASHDPLGIDGSLAVHSAWRTASRPVELHLFERGGHGFGMSRTGLPCDQWPELFLAWLQSQ